MASLDPGDFAYDDERQHVGWGMTLADFLLARIAEDEAGVRETYHPGNRYDRRVLAECEAKRRLLTDSTAITFADRQGRGPSDLHLYVIRTLAAVYADHPDYREEWKP